MNPLTTFWIFTAGNEYFPSAESSKAVEDIKWRRKLSKIKSQTSKHLTAQESSVFLG